MIIEIDNKTYLVEPCKHCKRDDIIYIESDLPWSDSKFICDFCCSTYSIFDTNIANKI